MSRLQPFLTRSHIFVIVFFAILLFLLYQLGQLLGPFSAALLWAGVIALALHPLYSKFAALFKGRTGLAAAVMTLFILLIIIGPAIALFAVLASQTVELYGWVAEGIKSDSVIGWWNGLTAMISSKIPSVPFLADIDIRGMIVNGLRRISSSLALQVGTLVRDTLALIANLFIMLFALFYFFMNGKRYYESAMDLLPFPSDQQQSIAQKLNDTFTAVINGVFLIASLQGIMTGIGFAVFGLPFPVFWGFAAGVLSIFPFGGAALIWIPGVLYLLLAKATLKGILFALWGTVLVSLPDNFLKPVIIGKKAQLPSFFLFLGILGGLHVYGFLGILLGPLIVTLLTAFIQIYREQFLQTDSS